MACNLDHDTLAKEARDKGFTEAACPDCDMVLIPTEEDNQTKLYLAVVELFKMVRAREINIKTRDGLCYNFQADETQTDVVGMRRRNPDTAWAYRPHRTADRVVGHDPDSN